MSGYQVQTGSQLATSEANAAVHFTQQFTTFILVFALIALVVACIVIYNTFTILITQRGRELALLRCVGASRGQVFRSTLLESAITGLAASAAGVLAGVGLGWGLQRLFAAFGAAIPSGPVVLQPSAVAIAMAAGLIVTVAAAVLPARSATRVAPVAALGGQHEQPGSRRAGWLRVAVAVVFAGAGILATATGLGHVSGTSGFVEIAAGDWPVLRGRARARAADRAARHRVPRLAPRPADGPGQPAGHRQRAAQPAPGGRHHGRAHHRADPDDPPHGHRLVGPGVHRRPDRAALPVRLRGAGGPRRAAARSSRPGSSARCRPRRRSASSRPTTPSRTR